MYGNCILLVKCITTVDAVKFFLDKTHKKSFITDLLEKKNEGTLKNDLLLECFFFPNWRCIAI